MTRRQPYAPPRIVPLTYTAVSKHLAADIGVSDDFDESYDVARLLKEFGSPLYVVSERKLRSLFTSFRNCFSEAGIETVVAYSYKTNYLPAVCAVFHEEGAWAEVVSGMEYELARRLAVAPEHIIFNGPFKTAAELHKALGEGALVNVDGFSELAAVERVADAIGRPVRIGLRISFQAGPEPWTKFGFNNETGDYLQALERVAAHPNLDLGMLHNHSGTFQLSPEIYGQATDVLIGVAETAREMGCSPTMIDLGGGFPSSNRLKPIFDLPTGGTRNGNLLIPFAESIFGRLGPARDAFGGTPTLVLEPGRAIVDSAVQLACTVVSTKDIPNRGKGIILDAGVNLLPTAYWYDHGVNTKSEKSNGDGQALEPVNIFGPLCMQIDVLRERALIPRTAVGQPLVISNVGAYCHTQSMQFIQTRPATVLLGPNGPEIIRRRETWRDVFQLDSIPSRLRTDDIDF